MKNEKNNIYADSTQIQIEAMPVEDNYDQLPGETYLDPNPRYQR